MRNSLIVALAAALFVGCAEPGAAVTTFTPAPESIRAHMNYLASDALEGRESGTPGYDLAATYVADQFAKIGLQPGGQGGYFQPVTLIQHRALPEGRFRLIRGASSVDLEQGADFRTVDVPHGRDVSVRGPLAFAGHGVVTANRDDFAGVDVRGKIVVVLEGTGEGVEAADFPFVSTYRAKAQMAQRRGAVGLIVVRNAPFAALRSPMSRTSSGPGRAPTATPALPACPSWRRSAVMGRRNCLPERPLIMRRSAMQIMRVSL